MTGVMDVEALFRAIGECGRQQRRYCALIFAAQAMAACQMVLMVFVGRAPTFFCVRELGQGAFAPKQTHNTSSACADFLAGRCDRFVFVDQWVSMPQEWQLVCTQSYRVSLAQSGLMGGVLVGALTWGVVADNMGRRKTVLLTTAIVTVASFLSGLAASFESFLAYRFIAGFGIAGHGVATFVLANELLGASKRGVFAILLSVCFAFGICVLALFAWLVTDWRQLTNLCSIIALLTLIAYLRLPESPRWLLTQGRVAEAKEVLRAIARGNGVTKCVAIERLSETEKMLLSPQVQQQKENLFDWLRSWSLCKLLLVQLYSWFANSLVYYGLTMASGSLSGNLYVSVSLSGLAEIPGYLLMLTMQQRIGRRLLICGSMVVGGCACLLLVLLDDAWLMQRVALALVGKMGISASFTVVWLHSAELLPTSMRNSGLGLLSMCARIGGVLAPFVLLIHDSYPQQHFVILGAAALSAGLLNMHLPETNGVALPECLDDVRQLQNNAYRKLPLQMEVC